MKFLALIPLIFLLNGCATRPAKTSPSVTEAASPVKEAKTEALRTRGVAWDLIEAEQLTLQFKNVDTDSNLSVVIEKGVSIHPVSAGHWELTGFEISGRSYTSMNISKKFVMRVKSNSLVYGGSVLIGCPKIGPKDFKLLKNMKFFNRYPFSGTSGLCEVVIGNNLAGVRTHLKNIHKSKKLKLDMGF